MNYRIEPVGLPNADPTGWDLIARTNHEIVFRVGNKLMKGVFISRFPTKASAEVALEGLKELEALTITEYRAQQAIKI
jgi:hypothetical protein